MTGGAYNDRQLSPVPTPDSPQAELTHAFRRRIVTGVMFLTFMAQMNQLVVTPALSSIGAQLGDVQHLPWVVTAYLLSSAIVPALYGRMGDIHGRRRMIYVAVALYLIGAVLCALAPTMLMLAFARGIQGLGGGGIAPLTQASLADVIPPRERGRYQAYFAVLSASASFVGPVIGGYVAHYFHWSWLFWMNLPLCGLAIVMSARALSMLPQRKKDHSLDLVGAGLLSVMSLCIMLALSWGGVIYPWLSPMMFAVIAGALVTLVAYALHSRSTPEPLVPVDVLRNRTVRQLAIGAFFAASVVTGLVTYAPLFFQLVLGVPASVAGLALTSMVLGATCGSGLQGRLISYNETMAWWVRVCALAGSTCAVAALAGFGPSLAPIQAALLLSVCQFGIGATYPTTTVYMQSAVEHGNVGIATSTTYFVRSLGGAASSAFLGAIFLAGGHTDTIMKLRDGIEGSPLALDPSLGTTFSYLLGAVCVCVAITLVAYGRVEYKPLRKTVD